MWSQLHILCIKHFAFFQKHTTHPGSQCAVPFPLSSLLGRLTRNRKNWKPTESSSLRLIVHHTQALQSRNFLPEMLLIRSVKKAKPWLSPQSACIRCFKCIHWTWYFRGGQISRLGTRSTYIVLQTLGYIYCHTIIYYYIVILIGRNVHPVLKPVS